MRRSVTARILHGRCHAAHWTKVSVDTGRSVADGHRHVIRGRYSRCRVRHPASDMPLAIRSCHRHLSDLRIGLLLRGTRAVDDGVLVKADACAWALGEARRLAAIGSRAELAEAVDRARKLLDEVDEALLSLDHLRDQAVFAQLADMRNALWSVESRDRATA